MTVTNTKMVAKRFIRLGKFCLKKALLRTNILSFSVDKSCIRKTTAPSYSAPVEYAYRYTDIKRKFFITVVNLFFYQYKTSEFSLS